MFIAHREAEARVMEALSEAGAFDITLAQSRLLQRLDSTGQRLTELAEQAGVTKQTAGALIDQLERAEYVVRTPDPSDARARLVVLSPKGIDLCQTVTREVAKVEREWRKYLGDKAYQQMREALIALRQVIDPYR